MMPKEKWVIETIRTELSENRKVILFTWHTNLVPRMARLLRDNGFTVAILESTKVPAQKREEWIDNNVLKKNIDILISNPVAVQTGLNNLVYFSTQIWTENPVCNPIVYRQAVGRVDRIGQKKETRIYFPYYGSTAQETMYALLASKVLVSMSTDGLDADSSLLAAGIIQTEYFNSSVGKQLYDIINASIKSRSSNLQKIGSTGFDSIDLLDYNDDD
jgi:SNF2 family DNA or RNA helicase